MEHKELGCVLYTFKKDVSIQLYSSPRSVFFINHQNSNIEFFIFFFLYISCFHDFLTIFIFFYRFSIRAVSTLFDRFHSTEYSRWCVGYIYETVIDHVTCIFVSLYFFCFSMLLLHIFEQSVIYLYLSCLLIVYIG
jgi:hypothetical protein